ncbi:MAG: sugar phosphate isomerase/epimerase family protein, partial [Alphaproteobacteria bacterium]
MQNFERRNEKIRTAFLDLKRRDPQSLDNRLNLSWSNWGFGLESLADSAARLAANDIKYIELHGNRYGANLGYKAGPVNRVLGDHALQCVGICGMFSPDNDLSSNRGIIRQNAIDYIKRNMDLAQEVGAKYFLVCPAAVGRPDPIDDCEFERSVETLRNVADLFEKADIRAAIEPIRSAETSLCHSFAEVIRYIEAVDHPGVQHINGDVYHMQV